MTSSAPVRLLAARLLLRRCNGSSGDTGRAVASTATAAAAASGGGASSLAACSISTRFAAAAALSSAVRIAHSSSSCCGSRAGIPWRAIAAPSRGFAARCSTTTCTRPAPTAAPRLPLRRAPGGGGGGGGARLFSSEASGSGGGSSSSSSSSSSSAKSPISFNSMLFGVVAFLGIVAVAQHKAKERVDDMMQRSQQVVGKAAVGGPFTLIDQDGQRFSNANLLGRWSVLYFGFTHCPDICPDELEKLAAAIDLVEKEYGESVQPVFITVDPRRDTPKKVKEYVREFHPRLVGLTGSEEDIKSVSKAYRVYFHKTTDDPDDYLVDHSIITYLIDPDGEFVTFYGKNFDAPGLAASIGGHITARRAAAGQGGGNGKGSGGGEKGVAGSQEGRAQR